MGGGDTGQFKKQFKMEGASAVKFWRDQRFAHFPKPILYAQKVPYRPCETVLLQVEKKKYSPDFN
jgi:hypothetical protein